MFSQINYLFCINRRRKTTEIGLLYPANAMLWWDAKCGLGTCFVYDVQNCSFVNCKRNLNEKLKTKCLFFFSFLNDRFILAVTKTFIQYYNRLNFWMVVLIYCRRHDCTAVLVLQKKEDFWPSWLAAIGSITHYIHYKYHHTIHLIHPRYLRSRGVFARFLLFVRAVCGEKIHSFKNFFEIMLFMLVLGIIQISPNCVIIV